MLWQTDYNPALFFTSQLHTASQSARGTRLGQSQISFQHMPSPEHACGFLDSQEYVKTFQSSLCLSHATAFPFKFFREFLVGPSYITTWGSYNVKPVETDFFSKHAMIKNWTNSKSLLIKISLVWCISSNCQICEIITIIWAVGKAPNLFSSLQQVLAAGFHGYHYYKTVGL